MAEEFRALVVDKSDSGVQASIRRLTDADLMPGDVDVRVEYSTVNYKDGLAVMGRPGVIRKYPLIPGIDLAGTVIASRNVAFKAGDQVLVNGWGLGETHHGGFAERARLEAAWLTRIPKGMTARDTMAVGTAGYTAALCVLELIAQNVTPASGPIIVTGAAGGVGSVAIVLLASQGYHVIALTGRPQEGDYLRDLGAKEIMPRAELEIDVKALAKERFAGAVDSVGSKILANILSMTKAGGTVTACGLAAGMDLPASVAPFILRGVRLSGVNSVYEPAAKREKAWAMIAQHLDKAKLAEMTQEITLEGVPAVAKNILAGKVRGRTVVKLSA
ncbi:MAG: MDR family oxidoreductase [Alphaproteobacteria bacterium]